MHLDTFMCEYRSEVDIILDEIDSTRPQYLFLVILYSQQRETDKGVFFSRTHWEIVIK